MITSIRYTNSDNTFVKIEPDICVCKYPSDTRRKTQIQQYLEGRTDEWDQHKAQYDNYTDIMSYDSKVAEYEQCLIDNEENQEQCVPPVKPQGHYTQEEADQSQLEHDEWYADKLVWESEPLNEGQTYPVREPIIKKVPADLPVISEPPELVPNTIEPYDEWYGLTLDDMKLRKRIEMKAERDSLLNGVTDITTSQGTYPVDVNQTNRSNMHQAYDNAVLAGIDLTSNTVWKMGDNQHYTIRYSELAEIGLQLGIYISDLYQNEAVKNAQIDACADRECIESVSWG